MGKMIYKLISKSFKFKKLNRVRNFYLVKHLIDSDTVIPNLFCKNKEISKEPRRKMYMEMIVDT